MLSSATSVRPCSAGARLVAVLVAVSTFFGIAAVTPRAHAADQPRGIDISRWQHLDGHSIDWGAVRGSGLDFVIVKATEATDYVNPYFASDSSSASQVGMIRGAYHFARPSKPITADAVAEARHFVDIAGASGDQGVLPPVLDLEQSGGLSDAELIAWTHTWLDTVTGLTGRMPMIYTYKNFWSSHMASTSEFGAYPLWLAYYNDNLGGLVGNWPTWAVWQYSAGGSVPGIYGRVDMNVFNGTSADLAALANGGVTTAFTPSSPFPPVNVKATAGDGSVRVTWLPSFNGGAPVTSYTLTVTPGDQTLQIPAGTTSATVPQLTNGQRYAFAVSATNSLGTSDPVTVRATPNVQTTLAMTTSADAIPYGNGVVINARLTRDDTGEPLAGRTVYLEGRTASSGGYSRIATLTTDADGTVSSVRSPKATATYRLTYAGGAEGASSATSQVLVRPVLVGVLSVASARVGSKLTLIGHVTPRRSGYVYRQMLLNGSWTTLDRTKLGPHGWFVFHVRPTLKGDKTYRVAMPHNATFGATASRSVQLRVR